MSTETISLHCNGCGANLRVAAGKMRPGASAPCPRCGSMIQFPAPAAQPQAPAVEEIQCQICGTLLRLRADRRPPGGGAAPCPRCKSTVTIPPLGAALPATPPPPPPKPAVAPPAAALRPAPAPAPPAPRPAVAPSRPPADSEMLPAGIGIGAAHHTPRSTPEFTHAAPARAAVASRPVPELRAVAGPSPSEVEPEVEETGSSSAAEVEPQIEIQGQEDVEESGADEGPPQGPPAITARPAAPDRTIFWTVEIGGESLHPGGVAELRLWARQGKLRAEDRVRRGDMEWTTAREVPELASLFARSQPVQEKTRITVRSGLSRETRRAGTAGLAGGALAVPPVAALLIFSGEFDRLAAALGTGTLPGLALLCGVVLGTGLLTGLVMAGLQKHYDRRGEVVNLWSGTGATLSGAACGAACGAGALAFWPPSTLFALLCGFTLFGSGVSLLTLLSYRWMFQEGKV